MRLKKMTTDLVEELKESLRFLEGQKFTNVFEDLNLPHLNSPISGSVEVQSTPTWYTHIHDILENAAVEYSEEDVEAENFLELKVALSPSTLDIYLYLPAFESPVIELNLEVQVLDIEKGSFKLKDSMVKGVQFNHSVLEPVAVA